MQEIPPDEFFEKYAEAMRVGEPGPCIVRRSFDTPTRTSSWVVKRSYHVLSADAVESLRSIGVGGGIAPCVDCGRLIFVPGKAEAGMMVHGLPERFAPKLKGVTYRREQ